LDDLKNAKEAYEHSLSLDKYHLSSQNYKFYYTFLNIYYVYFNSDNIYTNLNYSIFLYTQGDRLNSTNKLIHFRKNFDSILQGKRRDIDPEVKYKNFNYFLVD
jgi:hypothetical protein